MLSSARVDTTVQLGVVFVFLFFANESGYLDQVLDLNECLYIFYIYFRKE